VKKFVFKKHIEIPFGWGLASAVVAAVGLSVVATLMIKKNV